MNKDVKTQIRDIKDLSFRFEIWKEDNETWASVAEGFMRTDLTLEVMGNEVPSMMERYNSRSRTRLARCKCW